MDVNFYLIDWSKVEEKIFYKDFSDYMSQNPNGEYNFKKPAETNWIEYVPTEADWYHYVDSPSQWKSSNPLPLSMRKWDNSFESSSCFGVSRLKLPTYIHDEFIYLLELMFYPRFDYLFSDYREEFLDLQKIQHKIISPTRIASVLALWKSRDYLALLQPVYQQPESNKEITDFEKFTEYVLAWLDLFERAYVKPGWGILVYF